MFRNIVNHRVSGLSESIDILVLDEPGSGGANHEYQIILHKTDGSEDYTNIHFQNGPILESGFNGITGEALMAIQIDRLRCFHKGPYACRENAIALTKLEESLMWLQSRTRERIQRNVEGTHGK